MPNARRPSKRSGAKTARTQRIRAACFGHLPQRPADGDMALVVALAEADASGWSTRVVDWRGTTGGGAARRVKGPSAVQRRKLATLLEAASHPQRLTILATLLAGPATYRSLQKATGAKAGPLYHHVRQLRLANLIAPKERDLYRLTKGGRNLLLVLTQALLMFAVRRAVD